MNGGGCGRWRCGIEWIRGASLAASRRLTASDVRAFDVDDCGDGEDDETGGDESCGARSVSGEASCRGGAAGQDGEAEEVTGAGAEAAARIWLAARNPENRGYSYSLKNEAETIEIRKPV